MSTILWEHQQVRVDKTRDISTVLDSMREENLETLLASFADKDMKVANQLKQNIDKLRKK